MNENYRFSLENLLMSVGGHLTLVAFMVTILLIVSEPGMIIATDRIEIMEIDLNAVKIGGDETLLYNTKSPDNIEKTDESKQNNIETVSEPAPVIDATQKDEQNSDDFIQDDVPVKETKSISDDKNLQKNVDDAPRKKTIVRVNRQTGFANTPLTVSTIDALRVALTRCWTIDTTRPDISDIRAVAHLGMNKNGTVHDLWFESATRADTDSAFAYVLETIRNAINACQPFKMLPVNEFETWKQIRLTFYPNSGSIGYSKE